MCKVIDMQMCGCVDMQINSSRYDRMTNEFTFNCTFAY